MATAREMWVDGVRGILAMQQEMPGVMTVRELQSMLGLHEPKGITIADLPEPEPVHPAQLLAEMAEEFDQAR